MKPSINARYLKSTITNVDSHNHREEIDDCWRQHAGIKRANESNLIHRDNQSSSNLDDVRERAYWASKKTARLSEEKNPEVDTCTAQEVGFLEIVDKKERKKHEKKESSSNRSRKEDKKLNKKKERKKDRKKNKER